jgi:hypothetical protein
LLAPASFSAASSLQGEDNAESLPKVFVYYDG